MRFTRVCREGRTAGTALSKRDAQNYRESVAYVRHQSHKTSALDGGGDSVLADGGATGLAAADDFALTASEFFEQFDVFIVDEHGTRTFAVDGQRIAFLAVDLSLSAFTIGRFFLNAGGLDMFLPISLFGAATGTGDGS